MIRKKIYGGTTWVDLKSPTEQEAAEAVEIAKVELTASQELLSPSSKHKIEFGEKHAYLVIHFPAFKESQDGDAGFEVDFLLTKDTVVSTHYGQATILESFDPETQSENGIFFDILDHLLSNFENKLSEVDHWVREIEKNMFGGKEKQTIFELSEASRHLIDFRKITSVYPEVFNALMANGKGLFGDQFFTISKNMFDRFNKASTKLEMLSKTVHELRETNDSLVSAKQNETMKNLTAITVIATILVGIGLIWIGILTLK